MTVEWFVANHLDRLLTGPLFIAAVYVTMRARRSVRLWFTCVIATVAIACIALIHFLP